MPFFSCRLPRGSRMLSIALRLKEGKEEEGPPHIANRFGPGAKFAWNFPESDIHRSVVTPTHHAQFDTCELFSIHRLKS